MTVCLTQAHTALLPLPMDSFLRGLTERGNRLGRPSRRGSIVRIPAAGHSTRPEPIAISLFRRLKQEKGRRERKKEKGRGKVRDRGSERAKGRGRDREILII